MGTRRRGGNAPSLQAPNRPLVTPDASDLRFMHLALQQAEEAFAADEVPVGAVLVAGTKLLGKGRNQVEQLLDATAHAEMLALTAGANALGAKYLNDCTLYVTLEPCAMCAGALHWAQLGRLVFGAADEKHGYRRYGNLLHPKTEVTSGVLADEAAALLQAFFKARR